MSKLHVKVYELVLVAFISDSEKHAEDHLKEAEYRIQDLKDLNNKAMLLDSQMLVEKVDEYQQDANKWEYISGITKYHKPGFPRAQQALPRAQRAADGRARHRAEQ